MKNFRFTLFVLLILIFNAGCSAGAGSAPNSNQSLADGSASATPTSPLPSPSPTASPVPSLTPTLPPTPTPTPTPANLTADNFSSWVQVQAYSESIEGVLPVGLLDGRMDSYAYSPDGRYLAIGGCTSNWSGGCISNYHVGESFLLILDAETSEVIAELPETNTTIDSLVFTSDGEKLISSHFPGAVMVWNVSDGSKEAVLWRDPNAICYPQLALSPDDSILAVVCDSQLLILDFPSGDRVAERAAYPWSRDLPAFSADGARLAVFNAKYGNILMVYDTATWQIISTIHPPGDITRTAVLSPDGNTLATISAGSDGGILLWDVETGEQFAELTDDFSYLNTLGFTPDGTLLLSAGSPSEKMYDTISVWDMANLEKIGILHAVYWPTSFQFSSDGSSLITDDSYYLYLYRWSLPDADAIAMRQPLLDFLTALHQGDYQSAAALFQPSAEELSYLASAGVPTEDLALTLETLCAQESQPCMAVDRILFEGKDDLEGYVFLVQFTAPDGSIYTDYYGDSAIYLWIALDDQGIPKVIYIPSFLYP